MDHKRAALLAAFFVKSTSTAEKEENSDCHEGFKTRNLDLHNIYKS